MNTIFVKLPFQSKCIDNKNKPVEIPDANWIKEDETYTIIGFVKTRTGVLGFKLQEVELDKSCYPYTVYACHRFGLPLGLEEAIEEAKFTDDVDQAVETLIEESLLETV
jgi:hypothetical protein